MEEQFNIFAQLRSSIKMHLFCKAAVVKVVAKEDLSIRDLWSKCSNSDGGANIIAGGGE